MVDLNFKHKSVTGYLNSNKPFVPELAIVLGSGLGDFVRTTKVIKSFPTSEIEGYPKSTVEGHKGYIHFAEFENVKLLLFQGRIHFYEGYRLSDCLLPVQIVHSLGCRNLLITNASGGISEELLPGDLMLNTSFISSNIKKELTDVTGLADNKMKTRMLNCPSGKLNEVIIKAAENEEIELKKGVYWFNKGPAYETPAEVKMAGIFGASAVGMSSAFEAIYAASLGIEASSISLITNYAAGISSLKLSHQDVIETSEKAKTKFERLTKSIIILMNRNHL